MTRTEFVATATSRIEVLIDGQGPAIVFLPSSQRDSLHEHELANAIAARGFTLLRPQPRGMGRSTGALDNITLVDLAADIAAVIDQCGDGRAAVAGHAFGHSVARVADLHFPEKVRAVILMAAAARQTPPWLILALDAAADGIEPREERLAALKSAMFAPGNDPTPWLGGWYPALRPAYRHAGASIPKDEWWLSGNAPILDLQGAADVWRPESSRYELRDALDALGKGDHVTVKVIEGAGHAMTPERPEEVAAAMTEWLKGIR